MKIPSMTIIGLGALGKALARSFKKYNIPLKSVFNRSAEGLGSDFVNQDIIVGSPLPKSSKQLGKIVFITVPDDAIENIAQSLSMLSKDLSDTTFVHCSGNESADILVSLKHCGAHIASMHPLQTFNDDSGPEAFKEIYLSLQGDSETHMDLKRIARQLGGEPIVINSEQKAYLHASAVMASNYLMTLFDDATQVPVLSGMDKNNVKEMMQPLVMKTIKNIIDKPYDSVMSGPIARADTGTIKRHLALLSEEPPLKQEYCQMGQRTISKALRIGVISESNAKRLRKVFDGEE